MTVLVGDEIHRIAACKALEKTIIFLGFLVNKPWYNFMIRKSIIMGHYF